MEIYCIPLIDLLFFCLVQKQLGELRIVNVVRVFTIIVYSYTEVSRTKRNGSHDVHSRLDSSITIREVDRNRKMLLIDAL